MTGYSSAARRFKGVTLIMVAGVLAVLAAIGTGFYTLMLMQTKSATRYADSVRAVMMASAGTHYAVGKLRNDLFQFVEDPAAAWFRTDYLRGGTRSISYAATEDPAVPTSPKLSYSAALSSSAGPESDRFILEIEDAASKINLNAGENLAVILDNLCRVIGPPMVAADENHLQPRRWAAEGANAANYSPAYAASIPASATDLPANKDIYFKLAADGRPFTFTSGPNAGCAVYGDGYALAGYRARYGKFKSIEDVKDALTYVSRPGRPELEALEREVKFAALKPYITLASWVDTTTVCVGKFEWIAMASGNHIAIDRDKSWIASVDENNNPIADPGNERGTLRGCYVSIMNGHGAGQLRRIKENGADWIEVENGFSIPPGPISSYMIIAREDALLETVPGVKPATQLPKTNPDGSLVDDPMIDYALRPLCIHRAPVNINTASDKVLAALFMGINVQHGHYMALGTDADLDATSQAWIARDYDVRWPSLAGTKGIEPYLLTFEGLKRLPVSPGKLLFDTTKTITDVLPAELTAAPFDLQYITNFGTVGLNEAHELAARVISARQRIDPLAAGADLDPFTRDGAGGYERGPFKSWDDFYFRVIKPWDDLRSYPTTQVVPYSGTPSKTGKGKASLARMIMAHFNSNTDILKFNPNIEWIDRWGRNFTEMEPVFIYTNDTANNGKNKANVAPANPLTTASVPIFARERDVAMPGYSWNPVTLADFWYWVLSSNKAPDQGDGAFIVRSQRYKSDELIDKTDLNRSTTEFSFGSNGVFEIISTGQVMVRNTLLAERKIEALVKVYDVWRESTQAEFVQGEFSEALNQDINNNDIDSYGYSGRVTRDGVHTGDTVAIKRLAVTSLPEPQVPIKYRIDSGGRNQEWADPANVMRNAYGNPRANPWDPGATAAEVPDVLANRVLPARYDGQLSLAVNTPRWDPVGDKDAFLANFIGDLDTATSASNGREQSKVPNTMDGDGYKYRVVDTIGLLGQLNDTLVDVDPDLPNRKVYPFGSVNAALGALEIGDPGDPSRSYYYNNVTLRMGDLRSDGVYLSNSGVSGRDGTLKYLIGDESEQANVGSFTSPTANGQNYNANSKDGVTISMWAKPTWHQDDFRRHEFFNASNPGYGANCRGNFLVKEGRYRFSGDQQNGSFSNQGRVRNDFGFSLECEIRWAYGDSEKEIMLFGGADYVPRALMPNPDDPSQANDPARHIESPAYYIQPFRWHFLGGRGRAIKNAPATSGQLGHWHTVPAQTAAANAIQQVVGSVVRPFISTSLVDEKEYSKDKAAELIWGIVQGAPTWVDYTCDIGHKGPLNPGSLTSCCTGGTAGQDVKWDWADPVGTVNSKKVFSVNNLNYGKSPADTSIGVWQYRHMPDEGTYSVIDCFKISHKSNLYDWDGAPGTMPAVNSVNLDNDRAYREMTLSRYYLPPNPASKKELPWFKSQTLSRSLKGNGAKSSEKVAVARVTWTGFTPRFMHEYKKADGSFKRAEYITPDKIATNQKARIFDIKGPFDIRVYNDDNALDDSTIDNGRQRRHASAARPAPKDYPAGRSHASRGFEVELLQDNGSGVTVLDGKTFDNPDSLNVLGSFANPLRVRADQLRYRVRFLYPVDNLVDPSGGATVDPSKQFLLDTPILDDVSITYFGKPQFHSFREVSE